MSPDERSFDGEPSAAIAAELRRRAVPCRGGVTWLADGPERRPLNPFLYGGTAGICLFLAAHSRVSGDPRSGETALSGLAPLGRKLVEVARDATRSASLSLPIGGMTGLGSLLYTLVVVGEWLGRDEFFEMAGEISTLLSAPRIESDEQLDVVHGAAGALLGLLALHRAQPGAIHGGQTPLDRARLCGRHLVARAVPSTLGGHGWSPGEGTAPQTGFSHGAAGIGYALSRLHALTGEPSLRVAIADGLSFERAAFEPAVGNWRDLRRPEVRFMRAWCHGAPGIVLGRLGMLGSFPDERVREDIDAGLETLLRLPLEEVDHLCCGNLGSIEILHFAHRRLGDAHCLSAAEAIRVEVLDHAHRAGGFRLLPEEVPVAAAPPSLLKGLAGVGFALLRASDEALPSPLLLE